VLKDFNVAGLVRSCAWLERNATVEVLSIGKPAVSKYDCIAEIVGTHLQMTVGLMGGWIWISAAGMDEAVNLSFSLILAIPRKVGSTCVDFSWPWNAAGSPRLRSARSTSAPPVPKVGPSAKGAAHETMAFMDDFEADMKAIGRIDNELRLLRQRFADEGYSLEDILVMVGVCLEEWERQERQKGEGGWKGI
jgi:hypothetical protein